VGSEDEPKPFTQLDPSIGNQLIAPLLGKCYHLVWITIS